jgi:para-aminobenzoate synthetase component I
MQCFYKWEFMNIIKKLPRIKKINISHLKNKESVFDVYSNIKFKTYSSFFIRTDYTIIGYNPYLVIQTEKNKINLDVLPFTNNHKQITCKLCPWKFLKFILNFYKSTIKIKNVDFSIGITSVFGYDMPNIFCVNNSNKKTIPDSLFILHKNYVIIDNKNNRYDVDVILDKDCVFNQSIVKRNNNKDVSNKAKLVSNFSKKTFIQAVKKTKAYIKNGHIYQANISQKFVIYKEDDPVKFFKRLYDKSQAKFCSYIDAQNFCIISVSPERFLKRTENMVYTEPIKGTAPRSKNKIKDKILSKNLLSSKKEASELAMIVDVARNDLNMSSITNTVKVEEFKRIEKYPNVFHLIAKISCLVDSKTSSVDIIKNAFPPASVTGCPKKRSLEIINEIEKINRGFYCGAIGWLAFNGDFDLSVIIRTIICEHNKAHFNVGSGIVLDSNPLTEYNETLHKASPIFKTLGI